MASARSTYKVVKSTESPVEESLQDVFRCFICMEKLQEAHLCPHCSKLCCYTCISKWLTEQRRQCPHCRAKLHVNELVNCRWFEEVAVQVESLQQICANINPIGLPMDKDLCRTHEEKLTVYCLTCRCCICHQCALWGGTHSGHTFKKLELVYESHVAMVKEELTNSQKRLRELTTYIEEAEFNVMIVRDAKEERVKEIRNAVDLMIGRLDAQLKAKLTMVMRQKRIISKDKEELERCVQDIELQVSTGSRSQLINKSPDMLKSLMAGQEKSTYDFVPQHVPPDFVSEIVPQYDTCAFSIEKFTQLQKDGLVVYSKSLLVNGMCWRLKVYPCGNGPARGRYLSAFLELSNGHPGSSKYEYRIQMLHENISKEVSREFVSDFETGECWGYNRFFPLDLLSSEGYLNAQKDSLELRFQVRPPTFFQRSRDQQFYIHQLLKTHQTQAEQIGNLQEQLDRERKQIELLQSKPPQVDTQSLALVTGQTMDAQNQVESSRLSRPPLSSRTAEQRRSLIKSDKAEANEKIFSEILKCLSPNIGNQLNVGQRPSTAPASSQSGSSNSSSTTSSAAKIELSPLGNSSNSMLTESSDEDGAVASPVSSAGINVAILNGLTAAANASVSTTMGRKMNSLDALSVASSESESDENMNGGPSGSSSADDRDEDEDGHQAMGENLVEYAEVPVPAASNSSNMDRSKGGRQGTGTRDSASAAALEESVLLMSLLDMPAPISFRPGGRLSQPRQMQPVQSASVLETLLEPPRISSGSLVSQLSRLSSSGSSSSSENSSPRYRGLSSRSMGLSALSPWNGGDDDGHDSRVVADDAGDGTRTNNVGGGGGDVFVGGSASAEVDEVLSSLCQNMLLLNRQSKTAMQGAPGGGGTAGLLWNSNGQHQDNVPLNASRALFRDNNNGGSGSRPADDLMVVSNAMISPRNYSQRSLISHSILSDPGPTRNYATGTPTTAAGAVHCHEFRNADLFNANLSARSMDNYSARLLPFDAATATASAVQVDCQQPESSSSHSYSAPNLST